MSKEITSWVALLWQTWFQEPDSPNSESFIPKFACKWRLNMQLVIGEYLWEEQVLLLVNVYIIHILCINGLSAVIWEFAESSEAKIRGETLWGKKKNLRMYLPIS